MAAESFLLELERQEGFAFQPQPSAMAGGSNARGGRRRATAAGCLR